MCFVLMSLLFSRMEQELSPPKCSDVLQGEFSSLPVNKQVALASRKWARTFPEASVRNGKI